MAQIAGFDATFVPARTPDEPLRSEQRPDPTRVTQIAENQEAQANSRQSTASDEALEQFNGRVAFTAKFGPDETGNPLRLVRGDEVAAAENIDLEFIRNDRIARANREVLIRAQEAAQQLDERRAQTRSERADELRPQPIETNEVSFTDIREQARENGQSAGQVLDVEI